MMSSQFASILLLLIAGYAYAGHTIKYTVENRLEGFIFKHTMGLNNANTDFYSLMLIAQAKNAFFRFTSKDYGKPLGQFITSVNGLQDDIPNEKFWGFLLRDPRDGDCKLPVGVSNYFPRPHDHVVLSYITFDMLDELSTCQIEE